MKQVLRFAFPAYLLLEIFLTLVVASWLGLMPTLLFLAIGAAAGVTVLRTAQFSLLSRLRRGLTSGEPLLPGLLPGLLDGALRTMAGVLLIIPGVISDLMAAGLLIPRLRQWLVRRLAAGLSDGDAGPAVIEGDFRRIDDPTLPSPTQKQRQS